MEEKGYSPFTIARFFIEKSAANGVEMSPMKLIKMVYIAHAWHLAIVNEPLVRGGVQAWKYGPVIESLYHAFKHRGNSSIPLEEASSLSNEPISDNTRALLEKVWEKYSPLTAVRLSALTHQPGTPWQTAWSAAGQSPRWTPIPDETIKAYYRQKPQSPHEAGH